MDIYTYLKNDHKEVENLFNDFFSCDDIEEREDIAEALVEALTLHAEAEEENFYPLLMKNEATKDLAEHSVEEHAKVKQLMKEITETPCDEEGWNDLVKELQKNVMHHVKEEEEEIFPKAKKFLSEEQAKQMLEAVKKFKEEEMALS